MTPQDYTNDPAQPEEGKILEAKITRHLEEPLPFWEQALGVLTPMGISWAFIVAGIIIGLLGLPTLVLPLVIAGGVMFGLGVVGYVLVVSGIWVRHESTGVDVHARG